MHKKTKKILLLKLKMLKYILLAVLQDKLLVQNQIQKKNHQSVTNQQHLLIRIAMKMEFLKYMHQRM